MPIFEYRCEDCSTRFEKLVRKSADTEAIVCPECGTNRLKQELSTFAAHAHAGGQKSAPMMGGCGAGMCRTPDVCGRN